MTKRPRRNHAAGFKAKVALEAIKGEQTLIAKAMVIGATVVTHEIVSTGKSKIKIPNICQQFSIPYMGTFSLLRNYLAVFVLRDS